MITPNDEPTQLGLGALQAYYATSVLGTFMVNPPKPRLTAPRLDQPLALIVVWPPVEGWADIGYHPCSTKLKHVSTICGHLFNFQTLPWRAS